MSSASLSSSFSSSDDADVAKRTVNEHLKELHKTTNSHAEDFGILVGSASCFNEDASFDSVSDSDELSSLESESEESEDADKPRPGSDIGH